MPIIPDRFRRTPLIVCCLLAACGGGGGGGGGAPSEPPAQQPPSPAPTLQQRIDAARATVTGNATCNEITPFYWEIGDKTGVLASGTGGNQSGTAPTAVTAMPIASSTKWLFSTYVLEKQRGALSDTDVAMLNFTSGYANNNGACEGSQTVAACLSGSGSYGGRRGDAISWAGTKFYYDGGHMQVLASRIGLADDDTAKLAADMKAVLGADLDFSFDTPYLAGGGRATAAGYGLFLRKLLAGQYTFMVGALGSNSVCAFTNSNECLALYSPINQSRPMGGNDISSERWHYSLGHWVEDDPVVGDGAFSSSGKWGFYPWVDRSKTWYGVLARYDTANVAVGTDPRQYSYITSGNCGRLIRRAWVEGRAR